ncbi:Os07g0628301 [Oryza sativa Japonica Group]|uniref:Os07g0628301 protein n=1 Tax=Oryza sativa subsp. japonica TaxID=39947 RepID=A0A0P0X8W7_ORYSJ|nr:hypothetical protein EE612_040806 [Oryza sativa]BAT02756.1 Os07g0628301 [Oryza sativa Japonica Group]
MLLKFLWPSSFSSSSSPSPPPPEAFWFFLFTLTAGLPPSGLVREKAMCFSDSSLTMNDGMLTSCLPTLMWCCLIRTRAWWIDLAMPFLKTMV